MKLKNRNSDTPVGWKFIQPQISPQPIVAHSFQLLIRQVVKLRRANPGLCKQYNLSTDPGVVEIEIEEYIAAKCKAAGYDGFIFDGGAVSFPKTWTLQHLRQSAESAVGVVKKVMAGAGVYVDWLGSGGIPVSKDLANQRAAVCVECNQNKLKGGFSEYFTEPAADAIMKMIAIKNDMNLTTPHDEKLHVCDLCFCPLKAKIWAPISHVVKKLNAETLSELPDHCWIKRESK